MIYDTEKQIQQYRADIAKRPFILVSEGENWWHFRRDPKSIEESFTVTLTVDGTVCFTGDYGDLMLQRTWFPSDSRKLWGFPATGTDFRYFVEKVCALGNGMQTTEWDKERAIAELKAELIDGFIDGNGKDLKNPTDEAEATKKAETELDENPFNTEEEMQNEFCEFFPDIWELKFGRSWSTCLVWQFCCLCVWGDYTKHLIEEQKAELEKANKDWNDYNEGLLKKGWKIQELQPDGTKKEWKPK